MENKDNKKYYMLVNSNDKIEATDQYWSGNGIRWARMPKEYHGKRNNFQCPVRRRVMLATLED